MSKDPPLAEKVIMQDLTQSNFNIKQSRANAG